MDHKFPRFVPSILTTVGIGLLCTSLSCIAQPLNLLKNSNAYDNGYEDGYDDAMEDCPCPPRIGLIGSGYYLGGELGLDSYTSRTHVFLENMNVAKLHSSATGGLVNIFAGYGQNFRNNYYLGGEVFAGSRCADDSDTINTLGSWNTAKFSAGTTYGFGVMPGYRLNSGHLMFLRVGYTRTEFTLKETSTGAFNNSSKVSNWSNGVSYGLGMQSNLYKDFDVRVAYNHTCYNSFTNPTTGTQSTPSSNEVTLGLLYNFRNFKF